MYLFLLCLKYPSASGRLKWGEQKCKEKERANTDLVTEYFEAKEDNLQLEAISREIFPDFLCFH